MDRRKSTPAEIADNFTILFRKDLVRVQRQTA